MRKYSNKLIYSPSDLIRYVASPFASWMDRYYLENPSVIAPDQETEDQKLIAESGNEHEQSMLEKFKANTEVIEIPKDDFQTAREATLVAIKSHAPIVYQAALNDERFTGFADFVVLDESERYQMWDTKLARSPKPYYAIQLCCYSEMFAATTGGDLPEKFGIILGTKDRVEFRVEDFIHYYRRVRSKFLEMQDNFTNDIADRPEPLPGADHGRWTSYADKFFDDSDHLVRVAGITVGQIKKLKVAGITTMTQLASASRKSVPKLASDSLEKLVTQAHLQCATRDDRAKDADAAARYELLSQSGMNGEPVGLATLPPSDPADVFFDMEGYPLVLGGLEYLFGAISINPNSGDFEFHDWWAHDRKEEKAAFEGFIDWVHKRWKENPKMHIYHYAAYEVNAVSRLSTRHDTRQDEVDDLLRASVFVDLYKVVRHGLCIGEDSYSIKSVEHLYRPKRSTDVATAVDSIVQYAHWMGSKQPPKWEDSAILKGIRDYNEDDCKSTVELAQWLRKLAAENGISFSARTIGSISDDSSTKELSPEVIARKAAVDNLRKQGDSLSLALADVIDFHRREQKPMWWRMFDRTEATDEELRDDSGCIQGVEAVGSPIGERLSLIQSYCFDPSQECKLKVDDKVMFAHNIDGKFTVTDLDLEDGTLKLKISKKALDEKFEGSFPQQGSLIPDEFVSAKPLQIALTNIGNKHLSKALYAPVTALLTRTVPAEALQGADETTIKAATRIAAGMVGACFVIQGPPGTGKTYTAAQVIISLLAAGKKVGVTSNSHKAIVNLLNACGEAVKAGGTTLHGIKVGGERDEDFFNKNPDLQFVKNSKDARNSYESGVVGGTAWLFTLPEWEDVLDFLFIDEAGQVSLANAIAMARSAKNIILLGDQMQLEQPIQGTHPGDAGLSSLQYALKDLKASKPDAPIFHAVVPKDYGLFLGESRRMHPSVCRFISESIYEGRLGSHSDCSNHKIVVPHNLTGLITKEHGVVFSGVEHDGNIQQSDEEVTRVKSIYEELLGRQYMASDSKTRKLSLEDFLFICPYNAQVRALQAALPTGARVGSVDKFQGQEAPVCILSLCSSYGEYGSRGLAFILDRNRINVAVSRAQCLAVIVADPRIATTTAGSIDEMMLLNLFCKLADASRTSAK